jgi:hypothetical protein
VIAHQQAASICSVHVRFSQEGPACRVRGASEGRAGRVREITFDNPFHLRGHDKHAPPTSALGGTRLSGPENTVRESVPFGRTYLLAHEVAHIVDRLPYSARISQEHEFRTISAREMSSLRKLLPVDDVVRNEVAKKEDECFSWACTLAWLKAAQFRADCPCLAEYFRRRGLIR